MVAIDVRAIHLGLFSVTLVTTVVSLVWVLSNRDRRAATEFAVFLFIVALWVATQAAEFLFGLPGSYYLSFAIEGLRPVMAVAWCYFALTYAGYQETLYTAWVQGVVIVALLYSLVFSALPPVASAYAYNDVSIVSAPLTVVALDGTTLAFHLTEAISYFFVVVGSIGLVQRLARARYTEQWQTVVISACIVVVVLLDLFPSVLAGTVTGVDYSAAGVAGASLLFVFVFYRGELSGYVPVARLHVVESLEDPVVVLNPAYDVIDYNPAAAAILTDPDPIGATATDVFPCESDRADIADAIARGGTTLTVSNGDKRTVYDVRVTEVTNAGVTAGFAFVFSDVTELTQRTRALERQSERLDEFAGVVSHDLRNPLAVARGRLDLLDDDTEAIDDALARMDAIIEDALVMAREGQPPDDRRYERFRPLVTDAWVSSRTAEADLVRQIPEDTRVRADPSRLRTLFENLFRNSVDHGPDDVTVAVGLLGHEGFYVEDSGPGFDDDATAAVFEKGYTTAADSTGFGLAIVRSVVEAHGWDITATESDAGGARFEVTDVDMQPGSPAASTASAQ